MAQSLRTAYAKNDMMKKIRLGTLIALSIALFTACKNAPESAETTATAPKAVPAEPSKGETYTVQPAESKIEWIGTKVSGYHEGNVPIKSGQLTVGKDGI